VVVGFAPSMLRRLFEVLIYDLLEAACASVEEESAYLFLRQTFTLKLIPESLHVVM
jgi:hypothetical protein